MSAIRQFLSFAAAGLILGAASAAEAAGPKAYIGNFKDNTVSVVEINKGVVLATIPVSAGPHGMAIARDGKTVYVAGDGSANLDVVDADTDRVRRTVAVGKTPHGLALTPDGRI